ncbi:type VI secretion system Vgr family protein [Singulisphaera rosea]
METYLQADRVMTVTTPLGKDDLLLVGVNGHEAISNLFEYRLELLAERTKAIPFEALLGQKVTAHLALLNGGLRHFSGICSRISQGAQDNTFISYQMDVVPQAWFLTKRAQSRIFQQMSVPDILKKVLAGLDVTYELQGTYEPRDYCVQYRETDFNFVSRLMEEEGIFYFFLHTDNGHTMVVADKAQSFPVLPQPVSVSDGEEEDLEERLRRARENPDDVLDDLDGPTSRAGVIFEGSEQGAHGEERIQTWEKTQELRSGRYTLWDHSFELPHKHLDADKTIIDSVAVGQITHKLKIGNNDKLELYDYPGEYAQRFDGIDPGGGERASDVQKIFQDNARTVELRMQEEAMASLIIQGAGTCRRFTTGYSFTLNGHFNGNGNYLITGVRHSARLNDNYRSGDNSPEFVYQNTFTCIPLALTFRPVRKTPKPVVQGTQTAVVAGPSGEEIFTDKYGRVKVQFHWDREGKNDGNSSCWVRVGTPWAGKNWGIVHIPRIGQEVIVDFEEGDPDRPIIVGSVYNADMMPPYTLPDNKTQSGVKSRSSLQGSTENFNELRFEDKKGSEDVYFHAEKDFHRSVENDDDLQVGNDQTITVQNNRTESVKKGDESVTIEKGNRTVVVSMGDDTHQVKMGNRDVQVDMGNDSLTIKMGNQTTKVNLGKCSTEALQSIEFKVGQSSIKLDQMGVTIKGMMISVQGQIQTEVKGTMTQISGDAMLQARGGITMIN